MYTLQYIPDTFVLHEYYLSLQAILYKKGAEHSVVT